MIIDRVSSEISVCEFHEKYFVKEIPVILTGITDSWVAAKEWTKSYLQNQTLFTLDSKKFLRF